MKIFKITTKILFVLLTLQFNSCKVDEIFLETPTSKDAEFVFSYDAVNPNKVNFKASPSKDTWFTHWDFGDNSSAEGLEVSKVFLKKGDYDVRFKIFTDIGEAQSIQTVVVNEDFKGPNLIQNGEFNGQESWNVLPISEGVDVSFENSEVKWSGGNWGHTGIYQAINVLPNNLYQISMDIKGGPLTDSWFEVYVGQATPESGKDYSDGGIRIGLNTWEGCGNEAFEGDFSEISCVGKGSTFMFSKQGTVYLVIRGGGADFGDSGIVIDNVAVRSLDSSEVLPLPVVANFESDSNDLTVTFTNRSQNASSYTWDFGDGTGSSTEENPTHTYSEGGTYKVKLQAQNEIETVEITKDVTVVDPNGAIVAGFSAEVRYLVVTFTNSSINADSYIWDFGDGIGTSSEANPIYTYASPGTYNVKLTASKNDVSAEYSAEVTTVANPNIISNGTFDNNEGWTVVNHYEATNTNGSVAVEDGVVKFSESTNTDWKHMGIYTEVELDAGVYQFDMDMSYTGINDLWGEVYIGQEKPVDGADYSGDIYVLKAYNAWDCGNIKTYSGKASSSGCDNSENPGQFEITNSGKYYLLFRTGGQTYGPNGIVIDNMSVIKL